MTVNITRARVLRLSPEDNILVAGERIEKDAVTTEGIVDPPARAIRSQARRRADRRR